MSGKEIGRISEEVQITEEEFEEVYVHILNRRESPFSYTTSGSLHERILLLKGFLMVQSRESPI